MTPPEQGASGLLAEILRRHPAYRQSKTVFAVPDPAVLQVRINTLADGKRLIMPTPGLRRGFALFEPYHIPFAKIPFAVTFKGMSRFGRTLRNKELQGLGVDLAVAVACCADRQGYWLASGDGYFDLAVAVLAALEGVAEDCRVAVLCREILDQESIEPDPWDVRADLLVTPEKLLEVEIGRKRPEILWERLSSRTVRRIGPLWHIAGKRGGG